jgi:hypothetical protein
MNFSGCCDCIAVVDFSVKFLISGSISAVMWVAHRVYGGGSVMIDTSDSSDTSDIGWSLQCCVSDMFVMLAHSRSLCSLPWLKKNLRDDSDIVSVSLLLIMCV